MSKSLSKEEIQAWLIDNNFSHIEIIKYAGTVGGQSSFLDKKRNIKFEKSWHYVKNNLKRKPDIIFNPTKKEKLEAQEKTFYEKYGHKTSLLNEKVKEKIENTNLKKYGVKNPFENEKIKEKIKKTNIKKYGCLYPTQNEKIKEKIENTNLKKYGKKHQISSLQTRLKIQESNIKRWGFNNPKKNKVFQKEIRKKMISSGRWTSINGFTIPELSNNKKLASRNSLYKSYKKGRCPTKTKKRESSLEADIKNFLKNELKFKEIQKKDKIVNLTDFYHNKKLPEHQGLPQTGTKKPDFCFPLIKLIIEADGEYYHFRTEEQIKKDAERNKIYQNFGYDLLKFYGKEIDEEFDKVKKNIKIKLEKLNAFKT